MDAERCSPSQENLIGKGPKRHHERWVLHSSKGSDQNPDDTRSRLKGRELLAPFGTSKQSIKDTQEVSAPEIGNHSGDRPNPGLPGVIHIDIAAKEPWRAGMVLSDDVDQDEDFYHFDFEYHDALAERIASRRPIESIDPDRTIRRTVVMVP